MALRDLTPWRSSRLPSVTRERNDPFVALHREMDRLFDDFWRGFNLPSWSRGELGGDFLTPRLDVEETDKAYEVSVELPGLDEKDIELTLSGGVLTIKGEKKAETERKDKGHLHVERTFGTFQRSLSLPDDVDEDNIEASFKNGVLKAVIGRKAEAKAASKRIEIKGR